MDRLEEIIGQLEGKVNSLAARQQMLTSENARLRVAKEQLEGELAVHKNRNRELEEQNKVAKIARSVNPDGEDRKEERKKLNELVREIDKCIALLNN